MRLISVSCRGRPRGRSRVLPANVGARLRLGSGGPRGRDLLTSTSRLEDKPGRDRALDLHERRARRLRRSCRRSTCRLRRRRAECVPRAHGRHRDHRVDPDYQRQGVGARLTEFAADHMPSWHGHCGSRDGRRPRSRTGSCAVRRRGLHSCRSPVTSGCSTDAATRGPRASRNTPARSRSAPYSCLLSEHDTDVRREALYLCAGDQTGELSRRPAPRVRFRCPPPSAFMT